MAYYWDTIEQCIPPEQILQNLKQAGFANVRKHTSFGVFHAYMATKGRD